MRARQKRDFGGEKEDGATHIWSQDLFEGAFLLSCGHHLEEVQVDEQRGKVTASFLISGMNIQKACEDYRFGRATANVTTLKHSITHLKDVMFEQLRSVEKKDIEKGRMNGCQVKYSSRP